MENVGKAERLIRASGCGPFQVMIVLLVYFLAKVPANFEMMFMSFGNYNPGWRCLDNVTVNSSLHSDDPDIGRIVLAGNGTVSYSSNSDVLVGNNVATTAFSLWDNETGMGNATNHHLIGNAPFGIEYTKGTCPDFEACVNVEFDPDVSTIVTEWGLLCNKDWVTSLIISIQMAGLVVGELISGYLGDAIGRKKVLYGGIMLNGILSVISIFLPSWEWFAFVRFLLGIGLACVISKYCVLSYEVIPMKWRGRLYPLPAWPLAGLVMALTVMACKDWKIYHAVSACISVGCCLTSVFVPESLRWLEVKNKTKEFNKAAKKIISMNKLDISVELNSVDDGLVDTEKSNERIDLKRHTIIDLFRKGYKAYSAIFGFTFFSVSIIYYAINFGVKAMSGNFFINLIISFLAEIPLSIFPILAPNIIGRKKSAIMFMSASTVFLVVTAVFDTCTTGTMQHWGTLICALCAKVSANNTWYVSSNQVVEIYPTSVRSIAYGFGQFAARTGGVLAPLLIPLDQDSVFVCYITMSVLGVVCCVIMTQLPETRGRKLKETFNDS